MNFKKNIQKYILTKLYNTFLSIQISKKKKKKKKKKNIYIYYLIIVN